MVAKRKVFMCVQCNRESSRTAPNYSKALRRDGIVLCGECAFKNACKLKSDELKARYAGQPKNVDIVIHNCVDCGKPRQVQRRAIKNGYIRCKRCAAKLNRATNKEVYQKLSEQRVNNAAFAKAVSAGMLRLLPDVRSEIARSNSKRRWDDPNYRASEAIRRTTPEHRLKMRELWNRPEFREKHVVSTAEFVDRSRERHDNKYDYSKVVLNCLNNAVTIICPTHGEFVQVASDHMRRCGCPKCALEIHTSKWQQKMADYVRNLGFAISLNTIGILSAQSEIDIYLPNNNIGIECHGLFWHSCDRTTPLWKRTLHRRKADMACEHNIKLLQFYESEWEYSCDIVKSMIAGHLGICKRVYARKCDVVELLAESANSFFTNNHLQGARSASVNLGLVYNGDLLACMSLSKHPVCSYELIRFANLLGCRVVGGFTKLLAHFIASANPNNILTYADRRYSRGDVYKAAGFKLISITDPGYCYMKNSKLWNRRMFQKSKLAIRLEHFDPVLSESDNMFNNGFRKLWDAGQLKFVWAK